MATIGQGACNLATAEAGMVWPTTSKIAVAGLASSKVSASSGGDVTDTNVDTLTTFITRECSGDRELAVFMNAMQLSFKFIVRAVRKAGIADLYGLANKQNSTGDDVKKLDLLADEIMIDALVKSGTCALLVSEEQEEPIVVPPEFRGSLCCAFDPLDGSSNIDCNVSTGTIFSVFKRTSEGEPTAADILKPGTDMIAAGYCMYGSATDLVISFMNGVHRFTLDDSIGEFVYIGPMSFPAKNKTIYSCNEGNYQLWDVEIQQVVETFKNPTDGAQAYAARYVGSMVSDVHRTILYGGIFLYPADKNSRKGKLRLLYEGFPMASIIEQAGGVASTGFFNGTVGRILDVVPEHIHDRCPIIMGCERDTSKVLGLYRMRTSGGLSAKQGA